MEFLIATVIHQKGITETGFKSSHKGPGIGRKKYKRQKKRQKREGGKIYSATDRNAGRGTPGEKLASV